MFSNPYKKPLIHDRALLYKPGDVENDLDGLALLPASRPTYIAVSSSDLLRMRRNRSRDRQRVRLRCGRGLQISQGCGPHGAAWSRGRFNLSADCGGVRTVPRAAFARRPSPRSSLLRHAAHSISKIAYRTIFGGSLSPTPTARILLSQVRWTPIVRQPEPLVKV